jgi:hypothetical protein
MVSKQDKYLRQQAILRAEKYKEEQAKKVASHSPAKDTTGTPNHSTSTSISTDDGAGSAESVGSKPTSATKTQLSPGAGRPPRAPGEFSYDDILKGTADR